MKQINKIIKVANIIEDSRVGGPQKRMVFIASNLHKKIHTNIIAPKKNSKEFKSLCKKFNVKINTLSFTPINKNITSIINYLILFPYETILLYKFLKQNHFDLVHISGGSWQFKGIIASKFAGVKAIWHLNDSYTTFFLRKLFKLLSPLADGYIFSAKRAERYYMKFINNKKPKFVIHPPVDTKLFNPLKKYENNFKHKNLFFKKNFFIGTIGNINRMKGFETFIKAGSILNKDYKNLHFIIVGKIFSTQRKYFDNLKNLCKEINFFNIDFVTDCDDVRPFLQKFDIFAITSLFETGPMTLWEAMSMKKAIISSDVGDVKDFINDGINGYTIKVKDEIALAKKIKELIVNIKLRKKFSILARKTAIQKLDIKKSAKLHLEAYKTIYKNDY